MEARQIVERALEQITLLDAMRQQETVVLYIKNGTSRKASFEHAGDAMTFARGMAIYSATVWQGTRQLIEGKAK